MVSVQEERILDLNVKLVTFTILFMPAKQNSELSLTLIIFGKRT